jgi:hypothetical protein
MSVRQWCLSFVIPIVTAAATACGSSSIAPSGTSATTTAAATVAAVSLNLAGNWSGTLGKDGSNNPINVTWASTQSGATASGPAMMHIISNDGNGKSTTLDVAATMTAAISGSDAALTLILPAGSFTSLGSASCSVTAKGNTTPSANSLTSSLTVTFDPSCVGTVADKASEVDTLSLTKS